MTPYHLKYGLVPGVTYADHGRDLLNRLLKENVLCSIKGYIFLRPDLFKLVTANELRIGTVRLANLLDQNQTGLPAMSMEGVMGFTLGPLSVDSSPAYVSEIQEENVLAGIQGNYVDLPNYHQQASQVRQSVYSE